MLKTEKQVKQNVRDIITREGKILVENFFDTERGRYRFRIMSYNDGIYMFKDLRKPRDKEYNLCEFKDLTKMGKEKKK